jgi:hypothetical protein
MIGHSSRFVKYGGYDLTNDKSYLFVANSEGQGQHCTTLIFLTLDFEKKPSLREYLTGSLVLVCGAKWPGLGVESKQAVIKVRSLSVISSSPGGA